MHTNANHSITLLGLKRAFLRVLDETICNSSFVRTITLHNTRPCLKLPKVRMHMNAPSLGTVSVTHFCPLSAAQPTFTEELQVVLRCSPQAWVPFPDYGVPERAGPSNQFGRAVRKGTRGTQFRGTMCGFGIESWSIEA